MCQKSVATRRYDRRGIFGVREEGLGPESCVGARIPGEGSTLAAHIIKSEWPRVRLAVRLLLIHK